MKNLYAWLQITGAVLLVAGLYGLLAIVWAPLPASTVVTGLIGTVALVAGIKLELINKGKGPRDGTR